MAKTYDIQNREDFQNMVNSFTDYFNLRRSKGLPFQRINIISKQWRKPKSSEQHRKYWALVNKLKVLFIANGTRTNEAELHEFLKKSVGFTTVINNVMITKSISDISEDATSQALNNLIEFVLQFAIEHFETNLEADQCTY